MVDEKIANRIVADLRSLADNLEKLTSSPSIQEVSTEKEIPTLEEVRHVLAALSQEGKQVEVKEIITSFGVKKLSDVPEEKYIEILEKAARI